MVIESEIVHVTKLGLQLIHLSEWMYLSDKRHVCNNSEGDGRQKDIITATSKQPHLRVN